MSLLMEALKKAEELQRQAGSENAFAGPAADTAPAASPLPPLSLHLEAVDADLAAMSAHRPAPQPDPRPDAFLTGDGQAEEGFTARPPRSGSLLWPLVCAGLLAMLGGVGFFWWQLRAIEPPPPHPPPAARPPATGATVSGAASALDAGGGISPAPPADPPAPPADPPALPARLPAPPAAEKPPSPLACAPGSAASAPAKIPPRPAEPASGTPRLIRVVPPADILPLERAYLALQSGRDEEAQHAYEQVLRADGKNTDALLGLATLAARRGEASRARGYYLRALEIDPTDATARAGVLSLGEEDDADTESRLTDALGRQPGSAPLNFALGNLYARQRRWGEAQQAYFEAYTGDPGDPDLIFNLAVSLDHLRQSVLAVRYYHMALRAADTRTAAFDRARIEARLLELQK